MKLSKPIPVRSLQDEFGVTIIGAADAEILGINEIHRVEHGDLTFVDHPKYYDKVLNSAATIILIDQERACPEGKTLLVTADPFTIYNTLTTRHKRVPFRAAKSMISERATIGEGTIIQPGVFVGDEVTIGKDCIIHPNVTIYADTHIGDRTIIHANTVIGSDAFYVKSRNGKHEKMETVGRTFIGEDVEIGAGCTIDHGVSSDTLIGDGTKIDNLVQIGHGVHIGKHCLIAAQVGIAGKVTIEDNVFLQGKAGINKGITIGRGAVVAPFSGVKDSLPGGKLYFGAPAMESREAFKRLALINRLPEMWEKVKGK